VTTLVEKLEKMLAAGQDNALLRFSLGNEYLKVSDIESAISHLERALGHDPNYSAAWKLLGKACAQAKRHEEAAEAFRKGIEVAESKGDMQAAKEMQVFLKRLEAQGEA
jgi:Tfp pilus assembly protein PilF